MEYNRIYNFSAGPAVLPVSALEQARDEMLNYNNSGMSVMEMSHRSKVYDDIFQSVKDKLRRVMSIPDSHEILFFQGGASLQFAMAPMNLIAKTGRADYAVTGNFSALAAKEAAKFGEINIAASSEDENHSYIPAQTQLKTSADAAFFHYCSNNTIYGTQWDYVPEAGSPLVCDMSSDILSKPVDVSKYGVIYAGAQKNMAPAGVALVIIDKELEMAPVPALPVMLDYKTMMKKDSMYNTPPCYSIYIMGLVLDWIEGLGGLDEMAKLNAGKAGLLYDCLENASLFKLHARKEARSEMNVTFRTASEELDKKFAAEAKAAGLDNLKGHRLVGGMRASIYNAMPLEGVKALCAFIEKFQKENA